MGGRRMATLEGKNVLLTGASGSIGGEVARRLAAAALAWLRSSRPRPLRILGINTRVIEGGPEHRSEASLLLHGNPGSAEDWAYVQPQLADLTRAIALDLPGYGKAGRPREWDYSPASYAGFIEAAIDALGVERAHLVMHDLGGLGLVWAVNHPEQFASAVLIDTGNLVGFRWHRAARLYRTPVIGELLAGLVLRPLFGVALSWL